MDLFPDSLSCPGNLSLSACSHPWSLQAPRAAPAGRHWSHPCIAKGEGEKPQFLPQISSSESLHPSTHPAVATAPNPSPQTPANTCRTLFVSWLRLLLQISTRSKLKLSFNPIKTAGAECLTGQGGAPCREEQLRGPSVLTECWSQENQLRSPCLGAQKSPGGVTEPLALLRGCSGCWE